MKDAQVRKSFAKQLHYRRIFSGMTQRELADAAGIAAGSVSAYENGFKTPTVDAAARIAAALGTTLNEMLVPFVFPCPCCGYDIAPEDILPRHKEPQEVPEA